MKQIKRFGVLQTAKVAGVLYLAIGLVVGVLAFFGSMFGGLRGMAAGGILALLIPIVYAILGTVVTALMCLLYNAVAERIGGIEIDLG